VSIGVWETIRIEINYYYYLLLLYVVSVVLICYSTAGATADVLGEMEDNKDILAMSHFDDNISNDAKVHDALTNFFSKNVSVAILHTQAMTSLLLCHLSCYDISLPMAPHHSWCLQCN